LRAADRSIRQQRLGNLLRFAGVGINLVADDAQGHLMEIALKSPIEFGELRLQNQINETSGDADHHGRATLTMETERLEPIAPTEGDEQMARPLVGHRELHFDRRILPTKLRQPRPDPIESRFRGMPFSRRPGAGEQRLDFAELVAQLRLCRHKRGLAIQTFVAHPSM
jgi:hypothetical protein